MAVYKNVASQKLAVFAYDSTDGSPKTGDAANITAQISLNGGATAATNDVNPTELDATDAPGIYIFDLTQAETNADLIIVAAVSATVNIEMDPVIIYTTPGTNAGVLSLLAPVTHTSAVIPTVTTTGTATAVTTVNGLAANVITETSIAAGAIDATAIADNAITAAKIAANAITDVKINTGAITATKFAAGAINAAAIASNAIEAAKINAGAITNAKFAAGAIDATAIASNAITDAKIATGAITSVKFAAGAINAAAIAADAITDAKVAADVTIASVTGNVGGIAGTIQTLDALDTQQDLQHTTTQGRLPAALVSGRMDANTSAINDNVTAATNLAASASTIVRATASGTPTTTTMPASDLSSTVNDHYNGRIIIWTSGTLAGQATDITDYVGSTKVLTFTAVTSAPSPGDLFVIV